MGGGWWGRWRGNEEGGQETGGQQGLPRLLEDEEGDGLIESER